MSTSAQSFRVVIDPVENIRTPFALYNAAASVPTQFESLDALCAVLKERVSKEAMRRQRQADIVLRGTGS